MTDARLTFAAGYTVTAADMNAVASQLVRTFPDSATRDRILGSDPIPAGALCMLTDTYTLSVWTGSTWSALEGLTRGGDKPYRHFGRIPQRDAKWRVVDGGWIGLVGDYRVPDAAPNIGTIYLSASSDASSLTVSWNAVSGATEYQLQEEGDTLTGHTGTSRSFTRTVTPGATYRWRGRCKNRFDQWSGWSRWYEIRVGSAPSAPGNLRIRGAETGRSVRVTWDAVSGGTRYQVEWRNGALAAYDGASRDRTFSCSPNTQYECRVRATNATGLWSGWSGWVQVRTAGAPSTPSGLSISGATNGQSVRVTWDAVTGGTRYQVQWKNNALTNYDGASRNRTFSCSPATQYECRVRATNATGLWSGWSGWVQVRTAGAPSTPSGLSISGAANGQSVQVTWNAVSGGTNYQVQWKNNALTNYEGASRNRTFSCSPNTQYECRVRATNATGLWSGWSGWVQVRTAGAPSTPGGLRVTVATNAQSLQVRWNAVTGGTRYQLQWKNNALTNYDGASRDRTFTCTPATQYECRVRATNATGLWSSWSSYVTTKTDFTNAFRLSGGTSYQNGKYRVHVFSTDLSNVACLVPVNATLYAVGGGGGGGGGRGNNRTEQPGSGGDGGAVAQATHAFAVNDQLSWTVGVYGDYGRFTNTDNLFNIRTLDGAAGGDTTITYGSRSLRAAGGAGGETGRRSGASNGDGAGPGTSRTGVSLNLTGSNVEYGRGGDKGGSTSQDRSNGSNGTNRGDGGDGGDGGWNGSSYRYTNGGYGNYGLIAIRYRNKA